MRFLDDLRISAKLTIGFGLLVAAIGIVAWAGIFGLNQAYNSFVDYRSLARQANADGRVQANMLTTRVFVKDFVITPDEVAVQGVRERAAATLELIDEARTLAQDSVYRVILDSIEEDVNAYVGYFQQVTDLQTRRNELVLGTLNVVGPEVEAALTDVMLSAGRAGATEESYLAGLAVRTLLLGRLNANQFLMQNDSQSYDQAIIELRGLDSEMMALEARIDSPTRSALLQTAMAGRAQYLATLTEVEQVILERNDIINNRLDQIGPRIAREIERMKLAIQSDQDDLGPLAQSNLYGSQTVMVAVAAVAAAFALFMAVFIVRAITRPLAAITRAADAFSQGDTDVPLAVERRDELGRLARAFAAMRDSIAQQVTSLEQEVAVRTEAERSAAEQRQVFMDSSVPIIIEDLEGMIIDANQEAIRAYGYLRDELIGKPIKVIVPDSYHEQADDLLRTARTGTEVRDAETVRWDRHQNEIPVEVTFSQLRDQNGRITAIATIAKDISAQKAEAQSRAEAEQQAAVQRQVFMDSSVPIIIEDLDGIITDVNVEAVRAYGYLRDELIGQPITMLIPQEHHEAAMEFLRRSRLGEEIRDVEGMRRNQRGELIPVDLTYSTLSDEHGRAMGIATIAKDIRTQKAIQQALDEERAGLERAIEERTAEVQQAMLRAEELRDEAEAATQAKASFLATMSHEIRTPMNGIIGMVDLLRQSSLSAEHQKMLQSISESGYSLLTIINDILDFSKVEAGKLDLETIPFSLLDIVDGVAENVSGKAREKSLQLIPFVDPATPAFIDGDPVRVRQILMNLASNAVKFTESGTVEIRAEYLPGPNPMMQLRVIDEGIGIPEEALERLFTPFDQAESSTTRKFGGTGLGLSICKRLTELMAGDITVHSVPGEGSTFTVRLPAPPSPDQGPTSDADLADLSVLAIGTELRELEVCRRYLEHWQADVQVVQDGETVAGIKAALEANPGLDVAVVGSGRSYEELRRLRQDIESAGIDGLKVVLLAAGRRRHARLDDSRTVCLDVSPMRRVEFLRAVSIACGRASPEAHHVEEVEDLGADAEPLSVPEAIEQQALILVAEDNATNRDVIGRQLTMLGYTYEMAHDGLAALEQWREGRASILLTDCHMPEMDGYQLAETIRADEKRLKSPRAPIVAITANALQGEAERCLKHGMDDYLSKPLELKLLRDKLRTWLPHFRPTSRRTAVLVSAGVAGDAFVEPPVDVSALRQLVGDDEEAIREILQEFLAPSAAIIEEILAGHADRSADEVRSGAHKLKSAARSVGARALGDLCAALEEAGTSGDFETIDTRVGELSGCMQDVSEYVKAMA